MEAGVAECLEFAFTCNCNPNYPQFSWVITITQGVTTTKLQIVVTGHV